MLGFAAPCSMLINMRRLTPDTSTKLVQSPLPRLTLVSDPVTNEVSQRRGAIHAVYYNALGSALHVGPSREGPGHMSAP